MSKTVHLKVNGQSHDVSVEPGTRLLYVLRDDLGLHGPKFGCGLSQCGACTIHLDGQAVRSCMTPLSGVANRQVTTIEALEADKTGKALQSAWIELSVPQCGYCQAGQIMSATALLKRAPKPTDADIDNAMAGNICRCGTYGRIRSAIKRAAGVEGAKS